MIEFGSSWSWLELSLSMSEVGQLLHNQLEKKIPLIIDLRCVAIYKVGTFAGIRLLRCSTKSLSKLIFVGAIPVIENMIRLFMSPSLYPNLDLVFIEYMEELEYILSED